MWLTAPGAVQLPT